ncbi:MAG: hypothetical protein JWL69_3766 [Phycisphaerales bacterium]|nr:hypothetical protein [Phycisphaerales bacterium]
MRRNPGIAPHLQPGLPPDTIKQQLKRAGIKGRIDPIVQLYSWHNGSKFLKEDASRLGFAPPSITSLPQATIEFLQGLGQKVDPNKKIYGSFLFFEFDGVIRTLKLWKKFSKTIPRDALLAGRFVPFISYSQTGQEIALDTDPACNTRIVSIQPESMKGEPPLREGYSCFEDFLRDLVRANESGELLACFQTPGKPIDLPAPTPPTPATRSSAASKKKTIPASENVLVLRTDFSDAAAWESLRAVLSKSDGELAPTLDFLSDPAFSGVSPKQLPGLLAETFAHPFAVIIDHTALTHPDHPILVVDLQENPGQAFRSMPAAFSEIHDNLSTANMGFAEFTDAVDSDGIFWGLTH